VDQKRVFQVSKVILLVALGLEDLDPPPEPVVMFDLSEVPPVKLRGLPCPRPPSVRFLAPEFDAESLAGETRGCLVL